MNILRFTEQEFTQRLQAVVHHSSLFDPVIEERARTIVEAVRTRGDAALLELTERFDGAKLRADQLAVSAPEFLESSLQATPHLRTMISAAARNIELFSRKSLRRNWSTRNRQGGKVGEKFDPFQRVGVYIPGGTAPLVSTCLMTILLARVAGCPEIVVCTPCSADGHINPSLLFAARTAGATEVYRVGGAQAIAAMAYGTSTIPRVQKVFGPGNAYVVAAKRLLFGLVAVDLLPGPSEVLVLADDSADASFVAADLLAQAEHGSGHERVWLVTSSGKLLAAVAAEIEKQLPGLSRRSFIESTLRKNGWLIQVKSLQAGIDLVNRLAPEHCEVMLRQPALAVGKIVSAGAIFVGPYAPTVLGDYVAGPSHTLPTGGGGQAFAGLTVDQFQRRTSVVEYSRSALRQSLPVIQTFAELEGLDAHSRSAAIRLDGARRTGRGPTR
ncbi:MAG TPA: histidinol dehydrogenase [Candidatus Dormibacteraeota bacterium]|nr:histidinol dehydrogenase [Candidatus Dormibacteraeota bacterium]